MEIAIYVVATPIGNLSDISQRAVEILGGVDLIAAEDTRQTRKLLDHFGLKTKLISVHEHNERVKSESLVQQVLDGETLAIVSDAGTPLISDPGYHIVRHARDRGCRVVPIPGACAITAALSASGLSCSSFVFEGFLPSKSKARRELLEKYKETPHTVIFYESPHRVLHTLETMLDLFPKREIVLAREITKAFETFISGSVEEVHAKVLSDDNQRRGEFVILMSAHMTDAGPNPELSQESLRLVKRLAQELPPKKAAAVVADIFGENKKLIYQALIDERSP